MAAGGEVVRSAGGSLRADPHPEPAQSLPCGGGATAVPDSVLDLIERFSRRRRLLSLLRGTAEGILAATAAFALVAAADALLRPSLEILAGLSVAAWALAASVFVARALLPALARASRALVAREIERAQIALGEQASRREATPGAARSGGAPLDERLSSAVELAESAPPGVSPWMINRTIALAGCSASGLDPAVLVDARPAWRASLRALAVFVVAALACLVPEVRTFALRALLPGVRLARPSAVRLEVSPGDCRVSEGSSLVVTVKSTPPVERVRLRVKWDDGLAEEMPLRVEESGPEGESGGPREASAASALPASSRRFAIEFPALARGFTYWAVAPEGESPRFSVEIASPPRLRSVELRVRPPAYTGAAPRTVMGGDAEVLAGSEVEVLALLDGPEAASAALSLVPMRAETSPSPGEGRPREGPGPDVLARGGETGSAKADGNELAARPTPGGGDSSLARGAPAGTAGSTLAMSMDGRLARAEFRPESSVRWRLRLVGKDGLVADLPRDWEIKVVPDAPPSARVRIRGQVGSPQAPVLVGRDEVLFVEVAASDDVALRELSLVARGERGEPRVRGLPLGAARGREDRTSVELAAALDLDEIGARIGDEVDVIVRAVDVGGQTGESEPLVLLVASLDGSRASAAAARLRAELKKLVAQEEILRREHRAWSEMRRSFRPEDPQGHAGALAVSRTRLAEAAAAVGATGEAVRGEALGYRAEDQPRRRSDQNALATALDEPLARPLLALGDALAEWSHAHGDAFARAAAQALGADGRVDPEGLSAGAEIVAGAGADLERLRSQLGIAVARLEAEALVARSESASSRSSRTAPVVRGYRGWGSREARSGLLGRFYPNVELAGPHVFETRGAPDLTDYQVPGVGAHNWSVRYSGELRVPRDGVYVFTCVADDGVRLRVAGQQVIDAWRDQAPTTYSARVDLKAGWVPVELEMYQRGGGSRLWFGLAPEGSQAKAPTGEDSRHIMGEADRKALAALMSSLPREVLERADEKLVRDYETLSAVPETIAQMADDSGIERLQQLSRQQQRAASILREAARSAKAAGWVEEDLEKASLHVPPLVWAARTARDILRDALAEVSPPRGYRRGGIAEIRREVARSVARLEKMENASRGLAPPERASLAQRERAAVKFALERIGRRLDEEESRLLADAARAGASPGERAASLEAKRLLDGDAEQALAKAAEGLAGAPDEPQRLRDDVTGRLRELDQALARAEAEAARAEESRLAAMAAEALEASAELARRREARDVLGERSAYAELSDRVRELAREARETARFESAEKLEEALGRSSAELTSPRLEDELKALASRGIPADAVQPRPVAESLARAPEQAREALEEARQNLALAAQRLRSQGREGDALAREQLARDIGALLAEEPSPGRERLAPLAERAAALEGSRGEPARSAELRAAAERASREAPADAALSAAKALEDLARRAERASGEKPLRPELMKDLKELADMAPAPAEERAAAELARAAELAELAAEAARDANEIRELREELARAERESEETRRNFAALEDEIARSLGELSNEARRLASTGRDELASAAGRLASALPAEAARVSELAREAALPEPARNNAALAAAARERAEALSQALARPFAESYLSSAPEAANAPAGELGRELAGLAAEQERAAELLEGAAEREARLRRELAEKALEAAWRLEQLDRALASAAPRQHGMEPAAAASQEEANRLQRVANESQARANALQDEARRLWEAAAQARYAAQNLGANPWEREEFGRRASESERAAAETQAKALEAERQAIAAQEAANELGHGHPQGPGGPESAEPAAGPLAQAAQAAANMLQAMENAAMAAELAQGMPPTSGAAVEREALANASRAHEALARATEGVPAAAEALAQRLSEAATSARAEAARLGASEAGGEHQPGRASPQQGQEGQPGQASGMASSEAASAEGMQGRAGPRSGAEEGAARGSAPPAPAETPYMRASRAAERALGQIARAPEEGESYRRAARELAKAASMERLASAAGPVQAGPGQAQASSQERAEQGGGQSSAQGSSQGGSSGSGQKQGRELGELAGFDRAAAGVDQAGWARLPERVRAAVRSGGVEKFAEEHREVIRAYFRRLGEER